MTTAHSSLSAPAPSAHALANAAAHLAAGEVVLITDPARPKRGGVLVVDAARATDERVNFLAEAARGLIAVAMPGAPLDALGLKLQAPAAADLSRENYTVSVEARSGVSTGISAADRSRTLMVMADPATSPAQLVTPGHIFPAVAHPGGVLVRPGWAEACVDLANVAQMPPAVAFCEVLDAHGELATGEELSRVASEHGLAEVSVDDLIAHRMATETLAHELTVTSLPTRWGAFTCHVFEDELDHKQHLALTLGELGGEEPVLVRVHSECLTGDILGSLRCDCGHQLAQAMRRIQEEGRGALLYLRQEGRGIGLVNKVNAYALQDAGRDTVEANLELGFDADARDFRVGAHMLTALGVSRVRIMTNNPRKVSDLQRFGVEVVAREALELDPSDHNAGYLLAKKEKLGHILTKV